MHGPRCDDHQPSHRRLDLRAARRCLVTLGAALLLLLVALAATAPEAMARPRGEVPVAFKIPAIGVEAPMEVLTTVRGQMQDPTTAAVVSWYDDSARLGAPATSSSPATSSWAGRRRSLPACTSWRRAT